MAEAVIVAFDPVKELADGFPGRLACRLPGLDPPGDQSTKEIRQIAFVIRFFDFGVHACEKNLVEPDCACRFASFD